MKKVYINFENFAKIIDGLWDIVIVGNGKLEIENMFHTSTRGPEITGICLNGILLERSDGEVCELLWHTEDTEDCFGSKAHLKKLKEYIAVNQVDECEAKEILENYDRSRKMVYRKTN